MRLRALLAVVVGLMGCSNGATNGGDVLGPAPAPVDVGDGDQKEPPKPTESYDLELPPAGTLPLAKADVLEISDGQDVDMMTAWDVGADGSLRAAFDRSDVELTTSAIWSFASPDGRRFSKPRLVDVSNATLVSAPSFAEGKMYFLTASSLRATPSLRRWTFGDAPEDATELARIPGVDSLLSWPKFKTLANGSAVVAFRDGKSVPRFASSEDGTKFGPSIAVAGDGEHGAMPDVAETSDGTLAFSFQQQSTSEAMISYVVLSHDGGATWSERIRVSDSVNVHDTSFVARADGNGLDLYYIHPAGTRGFSLFRRALGVLGTLGPEERVTGTDVVEPSKPSVVRRKDGKLVAAWAELSERSTTDFAPIVQRIRLAEIASDASL